MLSTKIERYFNLVKTHVCLGTFWLCILLHTHRQKDTHCTAVVLITHSALNQRQVSDCQHVYVCVTVCVCVFVFVLYLRSILQRVWLLRVTAVLWYFPHHSYLTTCSTSVWGGSVEYCCPLRPTCVPSCLFCPGIPHLISCTHTPTAPPRWILPVLGLLLQWPWWQKHIVPGTCFPRPWSIRLKHTA